MKAHQKLLANLMVLVVAAVLCGVPEYVQAQQQELAPQNNQQQNGTTIDPSKGPLQPVPAQNDNNVAPSSTPPETPSSQLPATPVPQAQQQQQPAQQPLGTATAEGVPTVGGAASRPAGEAIAPAKQNQRHSLLIKMGLIVAAGIAAGTVVGLTKGTSGSPGIAKAQQVSR